MKNIVKQLLLAPVMACLLAFSAASASAVTTQNYSFGNLLTGSNNAPTSGTFATLSISTTDNKSFNFDLQILGNLNSVFNSSDAYVSQLRVNTESNADPILSTIDTSTTWGVADVRLKTNTSQTGGIAWDFLNSFCKPGNGKSCNNSNNDPMARLTEGERVIWTSVFDDKQNPLLASNSPGLLLKVQGFAAGGSGEYTAVSVVPEPETWAMMLAGLGLIGALAKRRRAPLAD